MNKQTETFKKILGRKLRLIRISNSVSTYDLQQKGFRSQQYKSIEGGQMNITMSMLFKYCEVIGADVKIINTLPLSIEVN